MALTMKEIVKWCEQKKENFGNICWKKIKEEIVKALYVAGDFLASGGVHDSSDFFSITISG